MGNPITFQNQLLQVANAIALLIPQLQAVSDRTSEDANLIPNTLYILNPTAPGAVQYGSPSTTGPRPDILLADLNGFVNACKDFLSTWNANNTISTGIANKALVNKVL